MKCIMTDNKKLVYLEGRLEAEMVRNDVIVIEAERNAKYNTHASVWSGVDFSRVSVNRQSTQQLQKSKCAERQVNNG